MQNNLAICIGRQLGSGGREVARLISEKLGIAYYDREIIVQAAKDSGLDVGCFDCMDEKPAHSLLGGWMSFEAPFYSTGILNTEGYLGGTNIFQIQSQTIESLADKGDSVFVGRCADYILRERPRVFSVFITAGIDDRVARITKMMGISREEALKCIEEGDKKRAEYYNYYTFKKWGDTSSYDICFNSSLLSTEEIAEKIIELISARAR